METAIDSVIRRMEAIHALPADGSKRIKALLSLKKLSKGEYFLRAGERPTSVGYLAKGWLRYFHIDAEGREFIRYFCNGGNFVASQSALFKSRPSAFSIQALEDSELAVFEYEDWLRLSGTDPAWGIIHRSIQEQALSRAEKRERSLAMDDAASRYEAFLREFPDAEEHVRQYDIASYLGVSPITLSRIRGRKLT